MRAGAVYLSLGIGGARQKPVTRRVGDAPRPAGAAGGAGRGVYAGVESGGHFKDADLRTAKGFAGCWQPEG